MQTRTTASPTSQQGIKRLALNLLFQSSDSVRSPKAVRINMLAGRLIDAPSKATLPQLQMLGRLMRSLGPLDKDPDIEGRAFLAFSNVNIRSRDFIMRAAAAVERDSINWNLRDSFLPKNKDAPKRTE